VQLDDLHGQLAALQDQEEKLTQASQRLQAKVEAFRTKKETIKATYSAAEAQTKINEAFSGISEEMGDVGLAIQRAEDKTAQMQARAGAIDELLASGALDDHSGLTKDSLTVELERMASETDVDSQLAQLKQELGGGSPTPITATAPAEAAIEAPKTQAPAAAEPAKATEPEQRA
jgi:phage shock protein A